MRRVLRWVGLSVLAVLTLTLLTLILALYTPFGREKLRQFAVSALEGATDGQISIGALGGNIIRGVQVVDLKIASENGAPFLSADTLEFRYGLWDILRRQIVLRSARLSGVDIVLHKEAEGRWNYHRIFRLTEDSATAGAPASRMVVRLHDLTVENSSVEVRTPWSADSTLSATERNLAMAIALSDSGTFIVEQVGSAVEQVQRYAELNGTIPLLRAVDPAESGVLAEITALSGTVHLLRAQTFPVQHAQGTVDVGSDTLHLREVELRLPASSLVGDAKMVFETGTWQGALQQVRLSETDFRALAPEWMSDLSLDFVMDFDTDPDAAHYNISALDAALRGATVAGELQISHGAAGPRSATVQSALDFSGVSTQLLERIIDTLDLPLSGVASGRIETEGTLARSRVDARLVFVDSRSGESRALLAGGIGYDEKLIFRALNVTLQPLKSAIARNFSPDFPLAGHLNGVAVLNGSMADSVVATLDLQLVEAAHISRITGDAGVIFGTEPVYALDIVADPLALAIIQSFAPEARTAGDATVTFAARGPLDSLQVGMDAAIVNGGSLSATGTVNLRADPTSYTLEVTTQGLDLAAVLPEMSVTSLNSTTTLSGSGFAPASMLTDLNVALRASSVNENAIDAAQLRGRIADGVLGVDTLALEYLGARLRGEGALGITDSTSGTLRLNVQLDSLSTMERWIIGDSALVQPRQARIAEAFRLARIDSARIARETEVQRAITGAPPPPLVVQLPPAIRSDSLAGSAVFTGELTGNPWNLNLAGELNAVDIVALGATADSVFATVSARVLPMDSLTVTSTIHLQSATAAGYALNVVDADVSHRAGVTGVDLTIVQSSSERYAATATLELPTDSVILSLSAMQLQFDSLHTWQLLTPARLVYSDSSISVDSLSVNAAGGMIIAAGSLGVTPADTLRLEIYGVEVAPLFAAAQSDLQMTGVMGAALTLTGRFRSPGVDGPLGFVDGSYAGNALPEIHSVLAMADGVLTADLVASRPMGTAFVVGTASIPMSAGVSTAAGTERPLAANFVLTDLPLELVPNLTTQISQMTGVVNGNFELSGTTANPVMSGVVAVDSGSAVISALGIQIDDLDVRLALDGDTLVVETFTGRSGGLIKIEGGVGLAKLSEPTFDLLMTANEAYVLNDERGRLRANMDVYMRGPYLQTEIGGTIRVLNGVVYIPDYSEKVVLDADDPKFLLVLDMADARARELYQPPNPFMQNLVMNVEVEVARDTWVRSADANIELFSDGPFRISTDRVRKSLAFEGVLSTDRGQYTFLSKRFEIRRGSATFIGEQAGINPTLQISGEHEVQLPASGAVQIKVNIGGTMLRPEIQLESDARPPLSQSDMLSYLAFGQSSGSLLQTGASGLVPEGGIGGVGKVAGQQLQGIALGTLFDQLEREAEGAGMRSLGLDLLNITPAPTYTEIAKGDILTFLQLTEFEAGRYVTPRTFVAGQLRLSATPGVRAVHRTPRGYRFEMTWEPRLLLREPTLSEQRSVTKRAFGLFLIREWRF